jgi:hypothetical protein
VTGLTRVARARVGYWISLAGLAAGAGVQWGLGAGLMAGGALAGASFLLLVETDEETR